MVPVRSVTVLVWSNHLARKVFEPELGQLNRSFFFPLSSSPVGRIPTLHWKSPSSCRPQPTKPSPPHIGNPTPCDPTGKNPPPPFLRRENSQKEKELQREERRREGRERERRGVHCNQEQYIDIAHTDIITHKYSIRWHRDEGGGPTFQILNLIFSFLPPIYILYFIP